MLVQITKRDSLSAEVMAKDTLKLLELQGVSPRLENDKQSRLDANIYGFKAEFAVARLFNLDPPSINVATDGGVDLWFDDTSIDVKFCNQEYGQLIFDSAQVFRSEIAVLVGKTSDEDIMRVNGWIKRRDFIKQHNKHDYGFGTRLVMQADQLNSIEKLWLEFAHRKHGANEGEIK
ncbi:hypothetical protein OAT86_01215 [Planktomarina sp.]|jgi:hypothetical protein|nr:hypothetical protein [Planktomarina sp.]